MDFLRIDTESDKEHHNLILAQTGLIEKILSVMDIDSCNAKYTPDEKNHYIKMRKANRALKIKSIDIS